MTKLVPISYFIVKVHSRCNLDCSYCYEYNLGNEGWKRKPREMSLAVFTQLIARVKEHVQRHGIKKVLFSFHGGEPLLRKPYFFEQVALVCDSALNKFCKVELGVQTNATLLSAGHIEVFRRHNFIVGTSLDGPKEVNDRFRIYRSGKGSHAKALSGISLLSKPENQSIWGGNLAVIDVSSPPSSIFSYLCSLKPPTLDFLEPDAHWDKLPPGKLAPESTEYAEWLIEAFDIWFDNYSEVPLRRFESIISGLLGAYHTAEYFGTDPVSLLTIATDGAYEAVDQIKVVGDGVENLALNVFDDSLDSVFQKPLFVDRQRGEAVLAKECLSCEFKKACGGGYYPHRFSKTNGFVNPSIYCADYKKLFTHVKSRLVAELNLEFEDQSPDY